jgi:hypothetical protein
MDIGTRIPTDSAGQRRHGGARRRRVVAATVAALVLQQLVAVRRPYFIPIMYINLQARRVAFLRQSDLVVRRSSALRQLAAVGSDDAMRKYIRLDRESFSHLFVTFSRHYDEHAMKSGQARQFTGRGRPSRRGVEARIALVIVLREITGKTLSDDVCLLSALPPSSRSRVSSFGRLCLLEALRSLDEARCRMPENNEEAASIAELAEEWTLGVFPYCIGTKDGKVLPMEEPRILQEAWNPFQHDKHGYRNVFYWLWDGTCALFGAHWPARHNDGYVDIFLDVVGKLKHLDARFHFVSDTAFTGNPRVVRGFTEVDREQWQHLPAGQRAQYERADYFFGRLRSPSEWGNRGLVQAFPILGQKAPANRWDQTADLVETCVRLHNYRVRRMGVGQIHTVMVRYERF